jgi:hypothetical protein
MGAVDNKTARKNLWKKLTIRSSKHASSANASFSAGSARSIVVPIVEWKATG